jgi:malate dehydrogenase
LLQKEQDEKAIEDGHAALGPQRRNSIANGGNRKVKVTIVGASGAVGSATAFRIAQDGRVDEMVLIDARKNLAQAHALDIEQAVVHRSNIRVYSGEVEDSRDSDIVIMAAGVPHRAALRSEFLADNLPLILDLFKNILVYSPSALFMIASVPVDAIVYLVHKQFSIPRRKILGLNRNDSCRFRWAIGKIFSVPHTAVDAFVLGEHGETQVPVFSQIQINGNKVIPTQKNIKEIINTTSSFYTQWNNLQTGRTAGWTSAESLGDIVASISTGDGRFWACSTPLEGEYGLSDVSLGVPVRLSPEGIQEILEFELAQAERSALDVSARAVKEQIRHGQELIAKLTIS